MSNIFFRRCYVNILIILLKYMNTLYYNNLQIHAAPGVHEKAFELLNGLNLSKNSKILVLGSGSGSFDSRLIDSGYKNLSSIDYSEEHKFRDMVTFYKRDLNENFDDVGKFDCIIGIEIIEHLENQAHFLRNISKLLNPNGKVIISSPNVENTYSRIKFLFLGYLSYFNRNDLKGDMIHINPVFEHIFLYNSKNAGLSLLKIYYNKNVYTAQMRVSFSRKILSVLLFVFSLILPKRKNEGEINIYLLEKSN